MSIEKNLLEKYVNKTYQKGSEEILNQTAQYFQNNYIFEKVSQRFLNNKISINNKLVESMKKVSLIDGNSVQIPYSEICDIINFAIFMENEENINENSKSKIYKIDKLTNILENGVYNEVYDNDEKNYTEDDVKSFIVETSKKITQDVKMFNEHILITFS